MAFHDLDALSPAAVVALADTCEALITAEGREPATARERQLQQQLFEMLLGRPWLKPDAAAVPAGLSGLITGRRQRQQVLQLLTVLAFLEPRLDQAKVQVLERGAAARGPIRDFHWDFWPWIERPLEAVRRELQVAS